MSDLQNYVNKEDITLTHPDLSKVWLDSGDVMRMLHCSDRTLNKLRSQGLPYYKIHRNYFLYKLDEVLDFINSRKVTKSKTK